MEKLSVNSKKIVFIVGFLVLFSSYFIPVFYWRFIAIGVVNFALGYFLRKINPFGKTGLFFIYVYPFLMVPVTIYGICIGEKMFGIFSGIIYLISCLFAYMVYKSNRKILYASIYFVVFAILALNYHNMSNYYEDIGRVNNVIGKKVPSIQIADYEGNSHEIKSNGKIQVVDIWATTCGSCIDAFPKFEKLKNDYKNDKEVMFYSLNLQLRKSQDINRSNEFVKKYSFDNYFTDESVYYKLNLLGIPSYMIIGKDGKIKYIGALNMGITETYHNIYDLIENEK